MTSIRDHSFHLESPGQSMSWKEQVFLMFCIPVYLSNEANGIWMPDEDLGVETLLEINITWEREQQCAVFSFLFSILTIYHG